MGACGPSSSHVLQGGNKNGNPSDVVIDIEPLVCPDVWDMASLPSVNRSVQNTEDPSNRDGDQHRRVDSMDTLPEICTERPEFPQNSDEAIVVGAVGSAAPWYLMGWAAGVEVEFMIDTGCQVTILATLVFEKMCVADLGCDPDCIHVVAGLFRLTCPR